MPNAPKDPAAVSLGKRGGAKKVAKGFSKMDPERRAQIAREAAAKRWGATPSCTCGTCRKCRAREAQRRRRADEQK